MEENRLQIALENLVARGELNHEEALKVVAEFERISIARDPRRKILSEVGGYLGGLFIFIAILILIGGRWQHISRYLQFSIFLVVAALLAGVALLIGKAAPARSRLAGLLGALASSSLTAAIFAWRVHGDGPIFFALALGTSLAVGSFLWNRTIVGELSVAGSVVATGTAGTFLVSRHFQGSHAFAFVLLVVGAIWLYLCNMQFFTRELGDAIAMSMLFLSSQLFFSGGGDSRFLSYAISFGTACAAALVYTRSPQWPLLAGAILSTTVGTGELVGTTLGGSLGATLGLLASGAIFVSASLYSFKKSKRDEITARGESR